MATRLLFSLQSPGAEVHIELRPTAFDPLREMQLHEETRISDPGAFGAAASFIGSMRRSNEGDEVDRMMLEHYPGMTENALDNLAQEANKKWDLIDLLLLHRVGEVFPGDPIVLVVVWSKHRAAAFDASRFLMEELKSRVPFWKKEFMGDNQRWVEKNTPG